MLFWFLLLYFVYINRDHVSICLSIFLLFSVIFHILIFFWSFCWKCWWPLHENLCPFEKYCWLSTIYIPYHRHNFFLYFAWNIFEFLVNFKFYIHISKNYQIEYLLRDTTGSCEPLVFFKFLLMTWYVQCISFYAAWQCIIITFI